VTRWQTAALAYIAGSLTATVGCLVAILLETHKQGEAHGGNHERVRPEPGVLRSAPVSRTGHRRRARRR
jgi:hypothetical protein